MTSIEVRIASESDAAILAGLRYEFRSSQEQVVESEEQFIERCTLWMQERLRSGSSWRCWIAEWQQKPVGNAWAQLIEKIPNPICEPEHHIYLTNFYVREEYRGKGVGKMLLSGALAWARINDVQSAILWPRERSRSLYLRQGFSEARDLMHLAIKMESKAGCGQPPAEVLDRAGVGAIKP